MKIDFSLKGIAKAMVYVFSSIYTWIDSTGLSAYVLTAIAVLMALDILLGWGKAIRVDALANPTSKRAKKGVIVKSVIFVIPAVVGLIWGALGDAATAMRAVNVQLTGILIAEGYSCVANAYAVYTGEELSEFDVFTYLFKKAGEKLRKILDKVLDDNE